MTVYIAMDQNLKMPISSLLGMEVRLLEGHQDPYQLGKDGVKILYIDTAACNTMLGVPT